MKRKSRILGVTLLEIMLVLAIAAMVIVMSIRYYQNATSSQQSNTMLQQILAIGAACDNLAQASGSYLSAVTDANVKALVGSNNMTSPWGTTITMGTVTATAIPFTIENTPTAVCTSIEAKLKSFKRFSNTSCTSGKLGYTYNIGEVDNTPGPQT